MSLSTRIESLVIRVAQEFNDVRAKAGHLASLSTTDKSSLVAAINELQAAVVTATAIDDQSAASTSTYSSVKIVGLLDALKAEILGGADAAYDTLLEIAVLLLALLAILAVVGEPGAARSAPAHPVLQTLARLATPLMIVVAVYLLWAGAFRPGGAFQAGAVLAAAGVLLHLARLLPGWQTPRLHLRLGLAGGFALFLAVAGGLLAQGALLQYPPALAGGLILLIESGLTLSLALTLAGLFLFLSRDEVAP